MRYPAGLGAAGRRFYRDLSPRFEGVGEREILTAAARTLDMLAKIEEKLVDAPLLVAADRGGLKSNPLLAEARFHRALFARLVQQLGVEDETSKSAAGRRMVMLRWNKGRRPVEGGAAPQPTSIDDRRRALSE